MIPFEFEYYKPETIKEAVNLFTSLKSDGKKPLYYGGGTEIISMARMHNVYTEAVIDIKGISECNIHELKNNELIIGSAITLTNIVELNFFPLLTLVVKRIADHTIQGKITLGGNLSGTIIYKEAALPLMVSNSEIIIANTKEQRRISLEEVFNNKSALKDGELITQLIIKDTFLSLPYIHVKRTKNEKIDYPLITIAALKNDNDINIAFSGLYQYPFRSTQIEEIINDKSISIDERVDSIIKNLPNNILNDLSGSAEYRKFMLHTMLHEALERLEEVD